MIVPQHWAEGVARHREAGRTITVRRHGWSESSLTEAQAMADRRAAEALASALAGGKAPRREPRVPYNGADGVPIREEVLARHGAAVITRNSYGARCLNVPNLVIVDIDDTPRVTARAVLHLARLLLVAALVAGVALRSWLLGLLLALASGLVAWPLANALERRRIARAGGPEAVVRQRLAAFLATRPDWGLRLYRTPAGWRVIATHATHAADAPEVEACFAALGADPVYATMCRNQRCFRARLSAKPWRIGIADHLRPRPGVWPVAPERLPLRQRWIADYEARAAGHAACRYVESLGVATVADHVQPLLALHDAECRALEPLLALHDAECRALEPALPLA